PLGLRLMRNGYLYVLDGQTNEIDEYTFSDQGATVSGKLDYPNDRTIYVCFSEVPWTEAKRAQVRDSREDRDAFMQAVNLAGAGPVSGGEHLIPLDQAEQWVAEFAEDHTPEAPEDGHPQEGEAYHWENEPYYHKSRIGKLYEAHAIEEPDECLCLLVRDDIGVMRDLAQFQDDVVGWIEAWSEEKGGKTERDYLLGSYIESATELSQAALDALAELDQDTPREALWNDLEALDDEATRRAVTDYLNHEGPLPDVDDASLPDDVQAELRALDLRKEALRESASMSPRIGPDMALLQVESQRRTVLQRESTRRLLRDANDAFVDEHLDALIELRQEQRQRIDDMLNGAKLGQRGVNELVRRDEMDRFLTKQREKLARWNGLLDRISSDRTDMLCSSRFQLAAWYFDPQDDAQVTAAFMAEYAVTRDIGRSDQANERIADWLQANPHFDRPMFYGLSLADGTALIRDYTVFYGVSRGLLAEMPDWIGKLMALEAGKLPDVDALSDDAQAAADGVQANLTPAVGVNLERAMSAVSEALAGRGQMPSVEELFRSSEMPKVLGPRLIDAARRGELTFELAS
ncbi:toxin VasX, partial [Litchfieldella anticariensis]